MPSKKRNNKKKSTKKSTVRSVPASDNLSNNNLPSGATPQVPLAPADKVEEVAPVAVASDENTSSSGTTMLPVFIQTCIDSAVGSRVIDIDSIIESIDKKIANGDYKQTSSTENTLPKSAVAVAETGSGATQSENDTTNTTLSSAVEYGIQSVVKSTVIDAYGISHASPIVGQSTENNVSKVASTTKESEAKTADQKVTGNNQATTEPKATDQKSTSNNQTITEPKATDQESTSNNQTTTEPKAVDQTAKSKPTEPMTQDLQQNQTSSSDSKPPAAPPKNSVNDRKKSSERRKSFLKKKGCIIL